MNLVRKNKQQGIVLVLVLIFLLVMTLLSVSSISSSRLQTVMLSNQALYQQARLLLTNNKQLVFNQLSTSEYSSSILQLSSVLDTNGKLTISELPNCREQIYNDWILLGASQSIQLTPSELISKAVTHLALIAVELDDIDSSKRLETLVLQQCTELLSSSLAVVETSIITRELVSASEYSDNNESMADIEGDKFQVLLISSERGIQFIESSL